MRLHESLHSLRDECRTALDSPWNCCHPPPPPVNEAPSWSQVDEPSTRRRLRSVPPPPALRPLRRRLFNEVYSIASVVCFVKVFNVVMLFYSVKAVNE